MDARLQRLKLALEELGIKPSEWRKAFWAIYTLKEEGLDFGYIFIPNPVNLYSDDLSFHLSTIVGDSDDADRYEADFQGNGLSEAVKNRLDGETIKKLQEFKSRHPSFPSTLPQTKEAPHQSRLQ